MGLTSLLKSVNRWLFEAKLGDRRFSLPPGDLGWPFIGTMWAFLRAFKSSNPDSFISSFVDRFSQLCVFVSVCLLHLLTLSKCSIIFV